MSFLRKASLSRKDSTKHEIKEKKPTRGPSVRDNTRPPTSRSVSNASAMTDVSFGDGEDVGDEGKPKKKKGFPGLRSRKLSSLFSSNSLSSHLDKDSSGHSLGSSHPPSHLNESTTNSTRTSSPSRDTVPLPKSYDSLDSRGTPPSGDHLVNGVHNLRLGTDAIPLTESPQSSPIKAAANGSFEDVARAQLGTGQTPLSGLRKRSPSMYSQWDEEEQDEESDEEAFLTPSEGLSEVEEEDEEQILPSRSTQAAAQSSTTATQIPNMTSQTTTAATSPPVTHTLAAGSISGATTSVLDNYANTGPSTIRRTPPKVHDGGTYIRKRVASTKEDALKINQFAVLSGDVDVCRQALTLFLTSRMKDAEDILVEKDPEGNHLYLMSGHALLEGLKGMMTFDEHDLAEALEICKATSICASALRKPTESMVSRLGGLVRPGAALQRVKAMTVMERHAELCYAEGSLMKALLAIVAGGDWLGLIREALNMRTAHGIYGTLEQYLKDADKDGYDDDIDMDFRSGVSLGSGTSSLMLSLLPGKVLKIAEVFGYGGDRKVALATLMSAGGWSTGATMPAFDEKHEGLRRVICDLILLTFHLVIGVLMPVDGTDVHLAGHVLDYNMKRYPNGVFFLYFQARLHTTRCEPELANKSLQAALDLHLEYVQLQHMCLWDYGNNHLMLCNWKGALDCYAILREESNWSRAVYTYSTAACIVELIQDDTGHASPEEADRLMKSIPNLTKKIAGKSLPIEKLCSRKARKFETQGHRLFLPAMELAYVFGALTHTPRNLLLTRHLPRIDKMLAKLDAVSPEEYGNGVGYWDDYCLGHFLRGVVQFTARYQPDEAVDSAKTRHPGEPSDEELDASAEKDFALTLQHGPDVQLDHYIIYHCHYELGRLYARRGTHAKAKQHFDVVMSGKLLEVNHHQKKANGKYSLEGALQLKTHAALQSLKDGAAK